VFGCPSPISAVENIGCENPFDFCAGRDAGVGVGGDGGVGRAMHRKSDFQQEISRIGPEGGGGERRAGRKLCRETRRKEGPGWGPPASARACTQPSS
jgi:hypothetical protein